jgi:hypothetical protein
MTKSVAVLKTIGAPFPSSMYYAAPLDLDEFFAAKGGVPSVTGMSQV